MPSGRVSPSEAKTPILKSAQKSIRTELEADAIATALIENLHCLQGKLPQHATRHDWYMALAYTIRDRMMHRYMGTVQSISETNTDAKAVAYLSAEFLTGPHLANGLINLGICDAVDQALSKLGQDLPTLVEREEEPGLGNGGLGRLAACYMDSLATCCVSFPALPFFRSC
jgi:glycogen phosphorylase